MCVGCLRTQVDITEDIAKQGHLYFCKFCERFVSACPHHDTLHNKVEVMYVSVSVCQQSCTGRVSAGGGVTSSMCYSSLQ